MSRLSPLLTVLLVAGAAIPVASQDAQAQPFRGSRLFVNQSMRYEVGRTFGIGVNFTIAPVKAAQKKLVEEFKKQDPNSYAVMLEAAQYVTPDDIRGLDAAGIKAKLKAVPTLSAEDRATIDSVPISDSDTALAADLLEIMTDPDTTITFSLEPYAEFHIGIVDLAAIVPIAGFAGDETKFAIGNLGLDVKLGHSWGDSFAFGLSYGLTFWAPTATSEANALGLGNLLWSPRYFSEYTTLSPYLVLGADLWAVTLQANVGYNSMFAVKGEPDNDIVQFMNYGFSLAITAIPYIVISAELSGLVNISNAAAYENTLFLTSGIRFSGSYVDIGLGFQVPLVQSDASGFAGFSNLSFGGPSTFNTILSATFGI